MAHIANPLQVALYNKLTGDATLSGKVTGVYDFVPQDTAFPYVTIGEDTMVDWSSHSFDGANTTVTIHTWARGAGRKTCKDIMGDIYGLLHNGSLSITGFKVVDLRLDFEETTLDPDGQTCHGVQRFRLLAGGN